MTSYNYKHLYYFWVVAKEGGISRAAERLDLAVQTVSAQVRELERSLGHQLLRPAGRQLALTPAGEAAFAQAEQIFQLGEKLPDVLASATVAPPVVLRLGLSDGLPKLALPRLLASVLDQPRLRLECHEGEFDDLLADLALHRLDLILADRPAPSSGTVRVYSHALGASPLRWFGLPMWADQWAEDPIHALARLPLLLPTAHATVRARLDSWFERQHLIPRIAGEFEDSALLSTFASTGLGIFAAPALVEEDLCGRQGFVRLGACDEVSEQFFLVGSERKVQHPLVRKVLDQGRLD
ncbi:MAG: LysR family transcriptional regulator [Rhodoferax sp.]|nr:LysR family transcriptional regulator [Rhodoferax sp.]